MKRQRLIGASLFCGLLSTSAAYADVTSAQVWQNWKDLSTGYGQKVTTTSEVQQGDTLVITGMVIESVTPEVSLRGTLDEVRFRELGDGRVEVTMSPEYPITVETVEGETTTKISISLIQNNLKMIADGTVDATSYEFTSDSISVQSTEVLENGAPFPVAFSLVANGTGGSYLVTRRPADVIDLQSEFRAGDMQLTVKATDTEQGSDVDVSASIAQIAVTSGGVFGAAMDPEQFSDALNAGFAVDLAMTYGAINYTVNVTDATGPTTVKGKVDEGGLGFAVDKLKMAYKGGARGVEVLLSGAQIPFPEVALRYAETAFDFRLPMSKAEDEQDFNLTMKVQDLTVSDEIWGLVDPGQQLSREPATLVIESRGKALLTADLTDEEAMSSGTPPGELRSLNIPALQLKIAGAELTGSGAFTFDNTDLTSFDGMPAPTGSLSLALAGGDALLSKLTGLGLVPADQAMSVRMMAGIFARPGPAPDTLTSTIEFKDKSLLINGSPMPF